MTKRFSEQNGIVFLRRIVTPLKGIRWVRTDQLLCIAEATNSKVYTHEPEAETHGQAIALVLLLKQYHTHYYWLYKKGTTRTMVGLQGLHSGNAFRCSNVSSSVGLKLFCPLCFNLGENTEMITTHLWEVHYRLAIAWDLCKFFHQHVCTKCFGTLLRV